MNGGASAAAAAPTDAAADGAPSPSLSEAMDDAFKSPASSANRSMDSDIADMLADEPELEDEEAAAPVVGVLGSDAPASEALPSIAAFFDSPTPPAAAAADAPPASPLALAPPLSAASPAAAAAAAQHIRFGDHGTPQAVAAAPSPAKAAAEDVLPSSPFARMPKEEDEALPTPVAETAPTASTVPAWRGSHMHFEEENFDDEPAEEPAANAAIEEINEFNEFDSKMLAKVDEIEALAEKLCM